ncbi:hypothetical protein Tco_1239664 [Tanacetum coccineum]
MPLAYRASTLANPDPMISPAFIEANYEVLKSLLWEHRRRMRNEDLRTELEYFSEEFDEERVMEPRPESARETTPVLRKESPRAFKRSVEDNMHQEVNLPPLLASHLRRNDNGLPLQSSLTSVHRGYQPLVNAGGNLPPNDFTSCMTPFVRWIEDYPLLDGLKMPSHVGSYDEKGDPDNYLHLFEGAIRSILNYKDLKAKFWSHFSQQNKFTKTHLAVHNIKQREGENTRAFVTRYTYDALQILGLHEEQRIFGFVHGLKTRSLVDFLSTDLPTTYKGLMEKTYT